MTEALSACTASCDEVIFWRRFHCAEQKVKLYSLDLTNKGSNGLQTYKLIPDDTMFTFRTSFEKS